MKKVLAFGSFDRLHPGHLFFLSESKKKGDMLYVVLAREKTIIEMKGKKPKYSEKERKQHLEITGIPDKVILGSEGNKYAILEEVKPDVICLGYDQKHFIESLPEELLARGLKPEIVRIKPYKEHIFKSSKLK
ncbi:FAD synthase [Candidatus Woesearchaeota archaeon]|nr:FAD synthase [Candidatus Woesearchaeota archaeon]